MVGNDVVDLRDPETSAVHPRFDARVFTSDERTLLSESHDRRRLRWILWAAKESAYKLARKLDRRLVFSPQRFAVDLEADEVRWGGERLALDIDVDRDRIHAVAVFAEEAADVVRRVEVAGTAFPGAAVRSLARRLLARSLGVATEELAIERDERIPRVTRAGRLLPVDLSLSHHGRFVAVAASVGPMESLHE